MIVTALYASLLTILLIVLSLRVVQMRGKVRSPLGDGGSEPLLRRIRVHANFVEYVPMALLLMGLAESMGTDRRLIHLLGIALLVGRILHAVGVSQSAENFRLRIAGMILTFAALAVGAVTCFIGAMSH